MQQVQVPALVRELRSHMAHSQKNQNIKLKWYCNKFSKDFKNGPHPKKKKQFSPILLFGRDTALGEIPVFSLLDESNKSFLLPVFGLVVSFGGELSFQVIKDTQTIVVN